MSNDLFITVIGGSECTPEEQRLAEEVGHLLAEQGATLICGGMGGIMEAACKGAFEAGGVTIGILPGEDRFLHNPYVKIPIVTGIGYARNVAVVKSGQAIIAIDGSYGTLSEIGFALQSGIPVIGLNTWELYKDGTLQDRIIKAATAREAVRKAIEYATDNHTRWG